MRIAGIMSGTSLDGVDVAIVDITAKKIQTVGHLTLPYPEETRSRILAVSNTTCHTRDISRLNFELPELYAKAVLETCRQKNVALSSIQLVGCHGQTVYHEGDTNTPNTLQLGEAAILAERLRLPVVSNFRPRDMAAGGKGAPLVPFLDQLLFSHKTQHRVALNIGGIANVTVLGPDSPVIAFDTGPGNMIIDQLVEIHTHGRQRYDRDGEIGAAGLVDRPLLDRLLEDRYFSAPPPKTAGREQYGVAFIESLIATALPLPDLIATATVFTAASISNAIHRTAPKTAKVIAAGGGVHNRQLMGLLAAFLPDASVGTTAEFGINPDAKEAVAFAVLAHRTWRRRTGNLPDATGASHPVILGDITL